MTVSSAKRRKIVIIYVTFVSIMPSNPYVKSEITTKEHGFFFEYLLLTLCLMAY